MRNYRDERKSDRPVEAMVTQNLYKYCERVRDGVVNLRKLPMVFNSGTNR